ncbi:MAG: tRNA uridine-5-carboxymethylaminomethyl(34) synthesis GTPase MnmE [Chloroflexi bacterium]|nr:tRNA uridine-5-carboxymethylaminomethyl(34) synthesis GTPase MnmE [Chloroflexota bacterium]
MNMLRLDDTIVAIATPPGDGAIGMVRLSGPDAQHIASALFRPSRARRRPWRSHRLYHGHVVDPRSGAVVDEVLLAFMRAPRTYTRQDVVEITGHGGTVSAQEIVRIAVAAGARPAERGEMTLRAFLLGRLDLAQAEAVLDAVRARTPGALSLAVGQLEGGLSRAVAEVRREIMAVFAHLEATIDFAEDDVPPPTIDELLGPLTRARGRLDGLLATARAGRLHREGVRVVICGRPNAGKSSLLNALVQAERAIVTPIPGTTRDVIEEAIDLAGVPAVLVDTAGIVETEDLVERIGVARSREALSQADVILFVVDRSRPLDTADREVASLVHQRRHDAAAVVVLSKVDLPAALSAAEAAEILPAAPAAADAPPAVPVVSISSAVLVVSVSSKEGTGLSALRDAIRRAALGANAADLAGRRVLVANARHRAALERARAALDDAIRSVESGMAADFVCIDLRASLSALGEITGESVTEDLLERIFSQFCIGK